MTHPRQRRLDKRPFEKFAFVSLQRSGSANTLSDKARRDLIRSHAKRAAIEKEHSYNCSHSSGRDDVIQRPPLPLAGQITVFRLDKSDSKKRRRIKARPKKDDSNDRPVPISNKKEEEIAAFRKASPLALRSHSFNAFQIPRDNCFIDPFDSLPIPLGAQQRMLLNYYSNNLSQSFLGFDPNKQLILQANSDPAWFNATISLVALHHDLRSGRGLSSECLYHRGEALRLVNEFIAAKGLQAIDESTVGTVASLANFDIMIGSNSNAAMHMKGLQHMIMLRGGLRALRHNMFLQSLVSWSDLLYSSAFDSRSHFNFACPISGQIPDTPVCIIDFYIYQEHVSTPPSFDTKMRETLRLLRILSLKKSTLTLAINDSSPSNLANRLEFSKCMYLAEYRLLTLFDNISSTHTSMSIRKPWQLSVYLYIHLALRDLPETAPAEFNLVKRLKATLKATPDLCELWTENLSLLLWIMFIGAAATSKSIERVYFIQHIIKIADRISILSRLDFITLLKSVMWLEAFCKPHATTVWNDVEAELSKTKRVTTYSPRSKLGIEPLLSLMQV